MVELDAEPSTAALITRGLGEIYPSSLDLNIIEPELSRVLYEIARDCTQPWLQAHRVFDDGIGTFFVVVVKTPTGVDGDLAVAWWLRDVNGSLRPYIGAIVPGYKLCD